MKKKVLLVERDWELAGRLPELLAEMGFAVEVAASGSLALGSLKEDFPDIIVSEAGMTGFEGNCFLDSLKSLRLTEHIPVLMTGEDRERLAECATKGAYIKHRPCSAADFAQFIQQMA